MKILFISNVMDEFMEMSPLGIMYLSASLKKAGHKSAIVGTDLKKILAICDKFKPDILGFSVTTGFHNPLIELNRDIKKKIGYKVFSLFGGPHATYFPDIIAEEGVDGLMRGEAEEAIVEFMNKFESGKDITNIANMYLNDGANIYKNEVRSLADDLDSLAFPDRDLILEYRKTPNRFQTFLASRGCPYECSYCFNESYRRIYKNKGKIVRRRSVANVVEEIGIVNSKIPLEHVSFQDDEFCSSIDWVREFSSNYKKAINKPFSCNLRPNLVTDEMVGLLKESGVVSISMAFEAGNDYVRNEILKRHLTKEQMINAAHIINKHRIFLNIQNMVGFPGGSLEADLETLRLNIQAKPKYAWVSLCHPYPNTRIGEYAKEINCFNADIMNVKPTYHSKSPLKIKDKMQVENLQKLFAVVVKYPKLYPLMLFLIKLPLTPIYAFIRKLFKGYVYYKEDRFTVKFTPKEKIKYAFRFLTQIGG